MQAGNRDDMVLVRVYGLNTEVIIDRDAEIRNMRLFHSAGCGPALLATFANGIAYEFVPGDILTVENVPDPAVNQGVIDMFAKMHRIKLEPGAGEKPCLWDRLRQFLEASPDGGFEPGTSGADEKKAKRFQECGIPSRARLLAEIEQMERELGPANESPVVHCHNDLLLGNIVRDGKKGKVTFIDHEYGAPNFQAFDLGNHFTEWGGVDGEIDYARYYPSEAVQKEWLRRYLVAYYKEGGEEEGREPTEEEVQSLYVDTNRFSLCANLKWGIWATVQAKNSNIDFDFLDYARQRLGEYFRRKEQFLAMKH